MKVNEKEKNKYEKLYLQYFEHLISKICSAKLN